MLENTYSQDTPMASVANEAAFIITKEEENWFEVEISSSSTVVHCPEEPSIYFEATKTYIMYSERTINERFGNDIETKKSVM